MEKRRFAEAKFWLDKTIAIAKAKGLLKDLAIAYKDYGNLYYQQYEYETSIHYYLKTDSICRNNNLKSVAYFSALGRFGKTKINPELYDEALDYLIKVRQKFIRQQNPNGINQLTFSMGMLEYDNGNLRKSLPYFSESLVYFHNLKMLPNELKTNKILGEVHLKLNQIDSSLIYFKRYSEISRSLKDTLNISLSLSRLGGIGTYERKLQ